MSDQNHNAERTESDRGQSATELTTEQVIAYAAKLSAKKKPAPKATDREAELKARAEARKTAPKPSGPQTPVVAPTHSPAPTDATATHSASPEAIADVEHEGPAAEHDTSVTVSFIEYDKPVGKGFRFKDGKWEKIPLDRSPVAKAITLAFSDFAAFVEYRKATTPKMMQVMGTFALEDHGKPCKYGRAAGEGEVAATKKYIDYRKQPGTLKLDTDVKTRDEVQGLFPENPATWATPELFLSALEGAIPELAEHPVFITDSTSARIHHKGVMRKTGDSGFHTDIPVEDATEIPAILVRLHYRLVAAGLGWAFVDTGGNIHIRSAVDLALKTVTQPNFCAPALAADVQQDRRTHVRITGRRLRLSDIEWSPEMQSECVTNIAALKAPLQATAFAIKKERNTKIAKNLLKKEQVTEKEVARVCEVLTRGDLLPTMTVTFVGPDEQVLVSELLLNGERFDQRDCLDPLRPDYDGGRAVGKFYWNNGLPMIHSFASGSRSLRPVWTIDTYPKPERGDIPAVIRALSRVTYEMYPEFDALLKSEAKRHNTTATLLKESIGLKSGSAASDFAEELDAIGAAAEDFGDHPPPGEKVAKALGEYGPDELIPLKLFHPTRVRETTTGTRPIGHIANVALLLDAYGIDLRYNVITKAMDSAFLSDDSDNAQEGFYGRLMGLANMNNFLMDGFTTFFTGVLDSRPYNPVTDYLKALVWDGVPRLAKFAAAVSSDATSEIAHRLFFIGACAAADGGELGCAANPAARKTYEYVVSYVGAQGVKKTSGIVAMVPPTLRSYVKTGVRLDISDKDSVKAANSAWITELGEIDATFRRSDQAAIKAFLSRFRDELRLPYARGTSNYLRRTIYIGSVNVAAFLHDKTGNRRFLPITVTAMPHWPAPDVDQLWAEAWHRYTQGQQWWPTVEEDAMLFAKAEEHTEMSGTEELLSRKLDFEGAIAGDVVCSRRRYTGGEVFNVVHNLPVNAPVDMVRLREVRESLNKLWGLGSDHARTVKVFGGRSVTEVVKGKVYAPDGRNRGYLLPPFRDGQHFGETSAAFDFADELGAVSDESVQSFVQSAE